MTAIGELRNYIFEMQEDLDYENFSDINNLIDEIENNFLNNDIFAEKILNRWNEIEFHIKNILIIFSEEKSKSRGRFDLTNILDREELKRVISINVLNKILDVTKNIEN